MVLKGRHRATIEGDFVVFLIGMRVNKPWKLAKWGPVADSYAKMFDWFQYALIESPVAGYDPVRALIDTDVMSKVMNDFSSDPKQLLDAAVTKANGILKQNAPKG